MRFFLLSFVRLHRIQREVYPAGLWLRSPKETKHPPASNVCGEKMCDGKRGKKKERKKNDTVIRQRCSVDDGAGGGWMGRTALPRKEFYIVVLGRGRY